MYARCTLTLWHTYIYTHTYLTVFQHRRQPPAIITHAQRLAHIYIYRYIPNSLSTWEAIRTHAQRFPIFFHTHTHTYIHTQQAYNMGGNQQQQQQQQQQQNQNAMYGAPLRSGTSYGDMGPAFSVGPRIRQELIHTYTC
jgi:hypothetical protein